jgi:glyoxylase-like metal-dependent hydrolase (beta-lactamase superfamily II)
MQEIFPSLFVVRPTRAPPKSQFPFLVRRSGGNVLFATKDDITPFLGELEKLGGVAHMLLGDRHHALPHTAAIAKKLNAVLTASDIEAKALKTSGVDVELQLPHERQQFAADLEIIPTPGHTRGAFSYLWSNRKKRFLFIGDTLVPIDGSWHFYVTRPQRALLLESLEILARLEFDVILSNSFAAAPTAWLEVDAAGRKAMFAALRKRLKE